MCDEKDDMPMKAYVLGAMKGLEETKKETYQL